MTKHQLAIELRQRQRDYGAIPQYFIDLVPDDVMIACYTTCCVCGAKYVPDNDLASVIESAESAENFIRICDSMADGDHKYPVDGCPVTVRGRTQGRLDSLQGVTSGDPNCN